EELVHDSADLVGGNGKAYALVAAGAGEDRGVNADQLAAVVDQRAAGVAGVDGCVGLDEVLVLFNTQAAAAGGADDAHGYRLADAKRIPYGQNIVADLRFGRVSDRNHRQVGGVHF